MKQWVKKLLEQFDMDIAAPSASTTPSEANKAVDMTEERATLLYLIDIYSKNLIDVDHHPVRKVRETLDQFGKSIVNPDSNFSDVLFRFRQFFSSYRIDETTYVQNSFDDFKKIIWEFADQLSEDIKFEEAKDKEAAQSFEQLREAVEANSIDSLRTKSRQFIDFYVKYQSQKEERRGKRMTEVRRNLNTVKKKLTAANLSMMQDHLTGAFNRRSFDEQMKTHHHMFEVSQVPVTLIIMDIDHFKKVNDTYGHDVGDFILKENTRLLREIFTRETDFFARIGGEEFAVILPDYQAEHAIKKAEDALQHIRKQVFIQNNEEIRYTISMGIAQLLPGEKVDHWLKRADLALYESKNSGRNKFTLSTGKAKLENVA